MFKYINGIESIKHHKNKGDTMKWERKILNVGNSCGIIIPKDLLDYLGLKLGDDIYLEEKDGKYGKFGTFWKNLENHKGVNNE